MCEGPTALHWLPDEDRWEPIDWEAWVAFTGRVSASVRPSGEVAVSIAPSVGLHGLSGGIHHFVVCIHDTEATYNIIPHKYVIEPDGRMGDDNFPGFTRDDREDYQRLLHSRELSSDDEVSLAELRSKLSVANRLPPDSLVALRRAIPRPPEPGSRAEKMLDI
jgi:hypothetical protein